MSNDIENRLTNNRALVDTDLIQEGRLSLEMSDFPCFAVLGRFSPERLEEFFFSFGNLFQSMYSSPCANIRCFSKGIIELAPSLHPSERRTFFFRLEC
jgi:hypothetical protein